MAVVPLGGFGCSRNALIALNILYICVSVILIGVAGYGIAASSISSFGVIIAIVTVGVFLSLIAVTGIIATVNHNQVMLFFYMVVLFLLFIIQFSVACACLSVGDNQIQNLMQHGWSLARNETKASVQTYWDCCGFLNHKPQNATDMSNPSCSQLTCCSKYGDSCCDLKVGDENCPCTPCFRKLEDIVKTSLRLSGGIGLFFSFTEIVGIFIALRYRNQKNPNLDPSDFL